MDRIAIFVDAGYLFAQGSVALCGSKRPRTNVVLDPSSVIQPLKDFAKDRAPDAKLLRIYWYDGAIGGARPTADQALLAHLDDVKLRLGFVNSAGQQKGVDSLIVTDLIELARLGSLSDAVLLSGDEDVRVGVQIAQNYGVRIHLLGIFPSRGSQSQQLLQEADTTKEWDADMIASFLALRESNVATPDDLEAKTEPAAPHEPGTETLAALHTEVSRFVDGLKESDVVAIGTYWKSERGVPFEHDKIMLARCRDAIGRNLERDEMREIRRRFQRLVRERLGQAPNSN